MDKTEEYLRSISPRFGCQLHRLTFNEFINLLNQFERGIDFMNNVFPNNDNNINENLIWKRLDWAVNYTLNPDFFDNQLKDRITNSVLVAALLITISGSTFINPTDFGVDNHDVVYRLFTYTMFIATCLFIISILLGIFFMENGMDRSYTKSDRIQAMAIYYSYFTSCQVVMYVGALFLLIGMILASKLLYPDADTCIFAIILASLLVAFILMQLFGSSSVSKMQANHVQMFKDLICDSYGCIRSDIKAYIDKFEPEELAISTFSNDGKQQPLEISSKKFGKSIN